MIRHTVATILIVGVLLGSTELCLARDKNNNDYANLQLFGEVFDRVRADYVKKVGDKQLIEGAIKGMLASLDPHSS